MKKIYIFILLCLCITAFSISKDKVEAESNRIEENYLEPAQESRHMETSSNDAEALEQQYQKYIDPFVYQIGSKSWSTVDEVDPDAFVVFFFSLWEDEPMPMSSDYQRDEKFGNLMIPAQVLEQTVQQYFDVESEYIKKSHYYDADKDAYWTGGIGSTADLKVTGATRRGDSLKIEFSGKIVSSIYHANWTGNVTVKIFENDTYQYVSYQKNDLHEEYLEG